MVGEVFFELFGAFDPILGSFFRNKFNVGKWWLFSERIRSSLEDTRSDVDNLIFVQDESFGDSKAPAHFKGSSDHRVRGGRWGGGKSEWILELNTGQGWWNIDQIDFSKEARKIGFFSEVNTVFLSDLFMHEPTGDFTIIDSIDQIVGTDDITSCIYVRPFLILHGVSIDDIFTIGVLNKRFDWFLLVLWTKGWNDVVAVDSQLFFCELVLSFSVQSVLVELHADCLAVLLQDLGWGKVGNEVDFIVGSWVENLFIGSHVVEASSENDGDSISADSEGGSGTVQSSVSNTQNNGMTAQFIQFLFAFWHFDIFTDIRQEIFRVVNVRQKVGLFAKISFWWGKPWANKYKFISIFFQWLFSNVFTELFAIMDFDSELFNHIDFPGDVFVVGSVGWDFIGDKTSWVIVLFENVDVLVAQSSQEWGAWNWGWACSD